MFASWPAVRSRHTASSAVGWPVALAAVLMTAVGPGPATPRRTEPGTGGAGLAGAAVPTCAAGRSGPATVLADEPWPQVRYDPAGLAAFSEGTGVRVAVVDSGVDAAHPQLGRALEPGLDLLQPGAGGDGRIDCAGHGTAVAGIIAAQGRDGSGLRGLAPQVKIIPIRVTETQSGDPAGGPKLRPAVVATAIEYAVARKADVINLSLVLYEDDPGLREAVRKAVAADVVVVAAVGNQRANGSPTPYPAAYPGVVGVGAVDRDGRRWPESPVGSYVGIVAAGVGVVGAVPGGGHRADLAGTSFAAPYVSATAALVRAAHPEMPRAEVVRRLLATADPAPGPPVEYGAGVLNPMRALTDYVPVPGREAGRGPARKAVAPAAQWAQPAGGGHGPALAVGAGALFAAAVVGALAWAVPHARRRRWRPGLVRPPDPDG